MKVGINARTFCVPEPGGAVQTAIKTTRNLVEDPEIEPILFGHEAVAERFPDVPLDSTLYSRRSQLYGLLWERSVLPRLGANHDVDVLYCPNGNGPLRSTSYPVVMAICDVNARKGWSSGVHQLYRKLTVPRAARVADGILTISNFSREEIVEELGASPSKIAVVYLGVDRSFTDGAPPVASLPEEYVLYAGAMNPRKNVGAIVESFRRLKARTDVSHKLVLVGPENKRIFKDFEVDEREDVVLPGYLPQEELEATYANADAFLFPSFYEGFGLPPLEAMASGTPVIASNVTSLPEVLGDAAVLVDPHDVKAITTELERVLTDRSFHDELVAKGRQRADEFTWTRTARETGAILKSVANDA